MIRQNGAVNVHGSVHGAFPLVLRQRVIDLVDSQLLSLYDVRSGLSRTQIRAHELPASYRLDSRADPHHSARQLP